MRTLFLQLFFLSASVANSQAIEVEWEKSFGGASYEDAYHILQTPDSNILLVGRGGPLAEDFSDCGENGGYVIVKVNTDGEMLWSKCYGGNNASIAYSVINSYDGGYAIAGFSYASDGDVTGAHGNADCWVVKINSMGDLEWQIAIGGTGFDSAEDIVQCIDGSFMLVGRSTSVDGDFTDHHGAASEEDLIVAKITIVGELIWSKSYGGSNDDGGFSITQDTIGNFIIAGNSESSAGDVPENKGSTDFWVLKIDSLGDIIWSRTFGGSGTDNLNDVEFHNGTIYLVGETYSNNYDVFGNHGSRDGWLLKIADDGTFIGQKCFGGTSFEEFYDIEIVTSNEIIISGISGSSNGDLTEHLGLTSSSDYWILKIDTVENIIWQKSLGGSLGDYSYSLIQLADESVIATGFSNSSDGYVSENAGNTDMWTVKLKVCYDKYFLDADGDGFGDVATDSIACNIPIGYVVDSTDCNDLNPDIHPAIFDLCNNIDDNCNGLFDEDATFTTYYFDADSDLFGAAGTDSISCSIVVGYVENNLDCNDADATVNPLATESCNGVDDNCNTLIDDDLPMYIFFADADGDTFGNPDAAIDTCAESVFGYVINNLDCNDTLATIYPGAAENCNYLDDDCNGLVDDNVTFIYSFADADGDNFGNNLIDSTSCELPAGYVLDNTDCDDTNPDIYPGAIEVLNGLDDDCDLLADEGLAINNSVPSSFTVFPNPTNNFVTIKNPMNEKIAVQVINNLGQVAIESRSFLGDAEINCSSLPSAIYLLEITSESGIQSFVLIKN